MKRFAIKKLWLVVKDSKTGKEKMVELKSVPLSEFPPVVDLSTIEGGRLNERA